MDGIDDAGKNANKPKDYIVSAYASPAHKRYMEDAFFVSSTGSFVGVFDGHCGKDVSNYLKDNLYDRTTEALQRQKERGAGGENAVNNTSSSPLSIANYKMAMKEGFAQVDNEVLKNSRWNGQGSTALAIWIIHEEETTQKQRSIIAANIGDCRAVLCQNGTTIAITNDQKPGDPEEQSRIEKAGGKVVWCGVCDHEGNPVKTMGGVYRINGNLAVARAIGDRDERPYISAEPEIVVTPVAVDVDSSSDADFLIIASDGLWDIMTNDEAVSCVHSFLKDGNSRERIAELMVTEAFMRRTPDNVTVIIVWL